MSATRELAASSALPVLPHEPAKERVPPPEHERVVGGGALRPAHEIEDENDEQNDHEKPDHSITCPCDGERHVFLLRRLAD